METYFLYVMKENYFFLFNFSFTFLLLTFLPFAAGLLVLLFLVGIVILYFAHDIIRVKMDGTSIKINIRSHSIIQLWSRKF